MTTKHYLGSKTVKYLGQGGMNLKRTGGGWGRSAIIGGGGWGRSAIIGGGGWGLKKGMELVRAAGKTNIMMRTAE